jgi:hypothetical protein
LYLRRHLLREVLDGLKSRESYKNDGLHVDGPISITTTAVEESVNTGTCKADVMCARNEGGETVHPMPEEVIDKGQGWKLLEKVLEFVDEEFSADENSFKRQLEYKLISYRLLWHYFRPGLLISFEDPRSKLRIGARVTFSNHKTYGRLKAPNTKRKVRSWTPAPLRWRFVRP